MVTEAEYLVVSQWARIGVLFNVPPAPATPDLEHLLVDTARLGRGNARLFIMAATWIRQFGRLVARHRLAQLLPAVEVEARAVLGLLLETGQAKTEDRHLGSVLRHCRPMPRPQPLFIVDCSTSATQAMARARASGSSRRWRLWVEPLDLKPEALRAAAWIYRHNPQYRLRAIFGGDLRASVLACLAQEDGLSEVELARRCGVTRKAMYEALDRLELAALIDRQRVKRLRVVHWPPSEYGSITSRLWASGREVLSGGR